MLNKVQVVEHTPELKNLLGSEVICNAGNPMLVQSERYFAIGCDLGNTRELDLALKTLPWLQDSTVLFVAEVSVTYMDVDNADRLLEWSAKVGAGMSETAFN